MPTPTLVPARTGLTLTVLSDRVTYKTSGAETAGAWALFEVESPPGSAVPLHRHDWDEAYYVLEGEIEFDLGGRKERASPGAYVRIPARAPHAMATSSPTPARYLLWASPCGADAFFVELEQASKEAGFGVERVLSVAAKHGIEVLAPGVEPSRASRPSV